MTNTRQLANDLFSDLDGTRLGIGWWKAYEPEFGVRARVLVGDHLCQGASSVELNMVEAKIHLLEFVDATERRSAFLARMVQVDSHNRPVVKHPAHVKPEDDLIPSLITLHMAGFFRAVASALDCMGTCMAGVLGLNGWILEGSFGTARGRLKNLSPKRSRDVELKGFRDTLEGAIRSAGPPGWLEWTLGYRHMLVHRPRRLEVASLDVRRWLVDSTTRPILRTEAIPQLARDPKRSDVEVWRDRQSAPVLTEAARGTMEEVLKSTFATVEATAAALVGFWAWRKSNVAAIAQPAGQWPDAAAGEATGFIGYAPGQLRYEPKSVSANPKTLTRMIAASVASEPVEASRSTDGGGEGD